MLSDEYRRNIMYSLVESDKNVFSYDEITDKLVENQYLEEIDQEKFKIQMVHNHLPRIEKTGFIDQDRRSETIRYLKDEELEELIGDLKSYE